MCGVGGLRGAGVGYTTIITVNEDALFHCATNEKMSSDKKYPLNDMRLSSAKITIIVFIIEWQWNGQIVNRKISTCYFSSIDLGLI